MTSQRKLQQEEPPPSLLIPVLSSLGTTIAVLLFFALFYFFKFNRQGRIMLLRSNDDIEENEQLGYTDEEQGRILSTWDECSRNMLRRAQLWQISNPPDSVATDITLSQYMSIQEKGVSAWELDPDLEGTDCFVEARTEIFFYDSECSVQSNLPVPRQNEVYYWESKMYEVPDTTTVAIGLATKPYPSFRLPGFHQYSVAYFSDGSRRCSQPFWGVPYGARFRQGDVVGVGYKPHSGYVFFTCNGRKFDEIRVSTFMNFFPTVGSRGSSQIHVNFGHSGFVFIEANVKRWGLAPMNGTLAPPPAYGVEYDSILLETGLDANNMTRSNRLLQSNRQENAFNEENQIVNGKITPADNDAVAIAIGSRFKMLQRNLYISEPRMSPPAYSRAVVPSTAAEINRKQVSLTEEQTQVVVPPSDSCSSEQDDRSLLQMDN